MRFIDEIEFVIASGRGGDGCISFMRAKYIPRGGPDGGDGGRGGAVIFEATTSRNTLVDFRRNKAYRAQNGRPGMGSQKNGAGGADIRLLVPVGTVIYDRDSETVLADLAQAGESFSITGGKGGRGNIHYKSSTRQTPRYAQPGEPGTEFSVRLELKLIADVGLLGFPNAGKSTLISRVSNARPRVADYPFTTLVPNLGVVSVGDAHSFVVADIPGLIEGAADGAGLGHKFLRHVERCAVYLHLVEPDDTEATSVERLTKLNAELKRYSPEVAARPQLVVLTKADILDPSSKKQLVDELRQCTTSPISVISAVSGEGLKELLYLVWPMVDEGER